MINGKVAVHLRAPVLSASGYGVHARQVIDYLLSDDRFIVFLENIPWGNCPFVHDYDFEDKDRLNRYYSAVVNYEQAQQHGVQYDISLQVTIPNEFTRRAAVNIGVTAGIEVDLCTLEWINACNEMDMIIVPSEFSRTVLSQTVYEMVNKATGETRQVKLQTPIYVIPEWFEKPTGELPDLGLKFNTKKNLLFVGLWGNKGGFGEDRKNVADLIRLFLTHFGDNPDYGLILKTNIITNSPEDLHYTKEKIIQIKQNFKDVKSKIYLLHEHLSEAEMWSLYHHPDILGMVSLTHGEGWGLPLLEAAAAGLPVIATNWSGHKDFLREKHGFIPIDFELRKVPKCQVWDGVIREDSKWACVDEQDFKRRLKKFLESPKPVQKLAKENIAWLEENFSKSAVMKKWREFFDSLLQPIQDIPEISRQEVEEDPTLLQELNHRKIVVNKAKELEDKLGLSKSKDRKRVLFVMPRSFGDVVIATSIANSLIANRHSDDDFYFATSSEYIEVLDGLKERYSNFTPIIWDEQLMNAEIAREIFDYIYNPTVNVQYVFSNWTLGNGEFGVRLLEEYAKSCNLAPNEVLPYMLGPKRCELPKKQYVAITAVQSKHAKEYKYWKDVVHNLKQMADIEVVQLGMKTEKLIDGCLDYRDKTFNETIYIVSRALLHISPDTGTAHVAAAMHVPHIVLFGQTSPYQCSPLLFNPKVRQIVIDSATAPEKRTYRDVDINIVNGKNTISQISPKTVCEQAFEILKGIKTGETHLPVLRLDKKKIDELTNEWYDSEDKTMSLREYLGLTQEQHASFIRGAFEDM